MTLPDIFKEPHLIKLDQYDLIEIEGKDAREFLNNQFTNDLKTLADNISSLGSWCSIKGRVLYTFRIWCVNETFQLILPTVQTKTFLKKLQMYVLRADVRIRESSEKFIYGLYGKKSDRLFSDFPDNDKSIAKVEDNLVINIPAPIPRFLIISGNNNLEIDTLSIESSKENNHWNLLDIMAGVPEILPDTADMFLPQMLNLEQLGGLSFQKGCYPGQEIVARVKYRGELKKQLYKATVSANSPIKPGSPLITSEDDSEAETVIGQVVNAVQLEENQWMLLAVINISVVTHSNISNIRLQQEKKAILRIFSE